MTFLQLALQRAGFATLKDFQRANDLYPSGKADVLTMDLLEPYYFGYRRHTIAKGDTFGALAERFDTTVAAIKSANPEINPERLMIGQSVIVPLDFEVVPTQIPFTSQVLQIVLRGLMVRYPFLSQQTLTKTDYGRPVICLSCGSGERNVCYNASHHANEWITTPLLLRWLERYCRAYIQNERIFTYPARELFQRCTLYIVPMVNPDGVDLVTGGIDSDSFEFRQAQNLAQNYPQIPFPDGWKANLNGVDLNLNYPAGWQQAREIKFSRGFTLPGPRDFVGNAALNQPETIAMVQLTQKLQPALTLSYHTQGEVIYWKYLDIEPEGAKEVGQEFARVSGYQLEDVPYASGFAGYKDWCILVYNRPAYTIEVGLGENPLPLSQFESIYRKNLGILTLGLVV